MDLRLLSSIDKKTFLFLNSRHSTFFDYVMYWGSNLWLWIPLYIIIFYCLIKFLKEREYFALNSALILTFIFSLIVITYVVYPPIFEDSIHRLRPYYNADLHLYVHTVGASYMTVFNFFVQKTCFSFALFTFLTLTLPGKFNWLKFVLVGWALLLSYGRIYLGMHYPLNVLAAMVTGMATGLIAYRCYWYLKNSLLLV